MYYLVLFIHIVVCIFLIIVILLQSGKAADLAGAFGGMGSQTAFGPRGSATLLSKATTISAVIFMVTSMALSIMATRQAGLGSTVLEGAPATPAKSAPAKNIPAPANKTTIPVPGQPQTGGQGTTFQIPIQPAPAPANQQSAPAPAQPAPAKK